MSDTKSSAHVRRVTLNLIRLAACCPRPLRPILDRLPSLDWDLARLEPVEIETIYTYVDDDLADRARAEFEADTRSIADHRHNPTNCKLCGHHPIRFEFLLRNTAGGRDVLTGSQCIIDYGINVDGSMTEDEALRALRAAIARAKQQAEREDWQAAHPDHGAVMAHLADIRDRLVHATTWHLHRWLRPGWDERVRRAVASVNRILRSYERRGYLNPRHTEQVFGGATFAPYRMIKELDEAEQGYTANFLLWEDFFKVHRGGFLREDLLQCQIWQRAGLSPATLTGDDADRFSEIRARLSA